MSDTDKDKPYWVTARWWEPDHWNCEHDVRRRRPLRVCDLPARPVVAPLQPWTWRGRRIADVVCRWQPDDRRHPFTAPPKWFRDHRWTNPQRRQVRDVARRAVAEHRGDGRVDVELPVAQHRHGARWDWE